jgi:hypothetical protein
MAGWPSSAQAEPELHPVVQQAVAHGEAPEVSFGSAAYRLHVDGGRRVEFLVPAASTCLCLPDAGKAHRQHWHASDLRDVITEWRAISPTALTRWSALAQQFT